MLARRNSRARSDPARRAAGSELPAAHGQQHAFALTSGRAVRLVKATLLPAARPRSPRLAAVWDLSALRKRSRAACQPRRPEGQQRGKHLDTVPAPKVWKMLPTRRDGPRRHHIEAGTASVQQCAVVDLRAVTTETAGGGRDPWREEVPCRGGGGGRSAPPSPPYLDRVASLKRASLAPLDLADLSSAATRGERFHRSVAVAERDE